MSKEDTNAALDGLTLAFEVGAYFEMKYGVIDAKHLLSAILLITTYSATHPDKATEVLEDVINTLTTLRDNSPSQKKKGIGRN